MKHPLPSQQSSSVVSVGVPIRGGHQPSTCPSGSNIIIQGNRETSIVCTPFTRHVRDYTLLVVFFSILRSGLQFKPQSTQTVATAAFWRIFRHKRKNYPRLHAHPLLLYFSHSTHRVATAAFWRTSHHDVKISSGW
jgi:hypothetical protein